MDTLYLAWQKISAKNSPPGIDKIDLSLYRSNLPRNLRTLQTAVATNAYRPYIEKTYNNKNRTISIHCVDDKIMQTVASEIITSAYTPSQCAHGYIKNRSIFTAKKMLDAALKNGTRHFGKTDIQRFYDSIDPQILFNKLESLIGDLKFLNLAEILLNAHNPGISTGSCLSPTLANLYLTDFDAQVEKQSTFYSRYVDDMLIAPAGNIALISDELSQIGLEINTTKSTSVDATEGFIYLGFDIKTTIDAAIQNGDYELADKLYTVEATDISGAPLNPSTANPSTPPETTSLAPETTNPAPESTPLAPESTNSAPETTNPAPETSNLASTPTPKSTTYHLPSHINNVINNCHIIKSIVEKAHTQHFIPYPEKLCLLQIFHCLSQDGSDFIHHILSRCEDYDYTETQTRINKYPSTHPLGCKKLGERIGPIDLCHCNFSKDKLYPTPIIYAKRIAPDCFTPIQPQDHIGHFKKQTPRTRAEDALSALFTLNKKAYEICEQQNIYKGQIEALFQHGTTQEFQTPHGLLIRTEDGIYVKVG